MFAIFGFHTFDNSQATNEETAPSREYDDAAAQIVRQEGEFSVVIPSAVGETEPISEMDGSVVGRSPAPCFLCDEKPNARRNS